MAKVKGFKVFHSDWLRFSQDSTMQLNTVLTRLKYMKICWSLASMLIW